MKDTIKLRSRGELVKLMQYRLSDLGYDIDVDGYFGPATEATVKAFQRDNNLQADGVVGPATWQVIEDRYQSQEVPVNWEAPRGRDLTGSLKLRSRGEFVQMMQTMLAELGYLLDADGSFGMGTDRVVRQFQRDNDLIIDGILGVNSLQRLSDLYYYPDIAHPTPKNGRIDRQYFFQQIKRQGLFRNISPSQYEGMNYILDGWEASALRDLRWLAYMLGTTKHETAHKMEPIPEIGKGRTRDYGRKLKMSRAAYTWPDQIYYGRGYVQLTWYENYKRMGDILGENLLENPELALRPDIAIKIMIEGMTRGQSGRGDFTGRKLEDFFTKSKENWYGARDIINGKKDQAQTITNFSRKFHDSLRYGVLQPVMA